jgi:micrococcal nuclease
MSTRRVLAVLGALATLLLAAAAVGGVGHAEAGRPRTTTVVRVVDGDTVVARLPGGEESVRLIGIDTPETVDPRKPVQCFGKEASNRTKALLPPGTPIRLERDVEGRDHFGRLLAYVYRADDGTFVNLALAEEGYAQPLSIAPNVAYASRFAAATAAARRERKGLWGACR